MCDVNYHATTSRENKLQQLQLQANTALCNFNGETAQFVMFAVTTRHHLCASTNYSDNRKWKSA